jgi:hypothetical protein
MVPMTAFLGISLLLLSLGWPLVALVAAGLAVHIAVSALKRRRRRAWTVWIEGSVTVACAAVAIYGAGFFYGGFF